MKSFKLFGLGLAMTLASAMTLQAQPASNATRQIETDHANDPVLKINGQTVTNDQLTSFAAQISQSETGYPPEGRGLINEYILTKLYDKIPTTATLEAEAPETTATPVADVNQRGYIKRLLREELLKNADVPREAMETWYKENLKQYQRPEQVHAWHIFMETSDDDPTSAPAKVREKMQQVKAKIDSGTSFSAAAKEYSEAASGQKGGEIGLISPRLPIGPLSKPMNPELETVFFSLSPNKVSDVVETRHGMHLLYITDKKSTRTPTIDDLITSGILPGALAQDVATSNVRQLVEKTIKDHNGKLLPGYDDKTPVTTDTVVFEFDGRKMHIGDLAEIFGTRFTSYLDRVKSDPAAFRKLMTEGMNDEAMLLAAMDKGVANDPATSAVLSAIGARDKAVKRIAAITDKEADVTDADIERKYKELQDQLRQPEAEGYLLEIDVKASTDTAEQAKAQNDALKSAEALIAKMKDADFEQIQKDLPQNDLNTTAVRIARHVVNSSKEVSDREFDRALPTVEGQVGVSKPVPAGGKMVIAKVEARYPGQPIALEKIQDRIRAMLEGEKRAAVREDLVKRLVDKGLVTYLEGAREYGIATGDQNTTAAASTQTSGTASAGENQTTSAAASGASGDTKVLELKLPKPVFVGTPKNISVANLEPAGTKPPTIKVPNDVKNLAAGKEVTASDEEPIIGELDQITDGDKEAADGSYVEFGPGVQWVQVDLGQESEIYAVAIWHYHQQARVFNDVIVKTADDSDFITNVHTIFNNDTDNSAKQGVGKDKSYIETNEGKLIDAKGVKGRYVRCYTNGNTNSDTNQYIEVEVYGRPAK